MRRVTALAAWALPLTVAASVQAEPANANATWALIAGSASSLAGFIVGSALLGTSGDDSTQKNAGWLTMQGGFALAPLAAHAISHEWGRGALFAILPSAALAAATGMLQYAPQAIDHGTLVQQRILWTLLGAGLGTSMVGVVDALFAADREPAIYVAPAFGASSHRTGPIAGLTVGGVL